MRVIEALIKTQEKIETALITAGLVKGQFLKQSEVIAETRPIFWNTVVTSKEASEKITYLTFNIYQVKPTLYLEGDPNREGQATINVFTRTQDINNLLNKIESAFIDEGFDFELNSRGYNPDMQYYYYSFEVGALL